MKRVICIVALFGLLVAGGPAMAEPAFEYLGCDDLGSGRYQHNYELSNIDGTVPIYDVEGDIEYYHATFYYKGPMGWEFDSDEIHFKWWTNASPVDVENNLVGFTITAGTPDVYIGGVTVTNVEHEVVWAGQTQWPQKIPAAIPSLTQWGVIVLVMLLLAAGAIVIRRRRAMAQA